MRKIYLLAIILFCCLAIQAQASKPRGTYLNFNYVSSKLKNTSDKSSLKNNYGAAITIGHTFYLHKEPLWNMVRFGIDWTIFDLNFSQYFDTYFDDYEDDKVKIYQGEAGMHVGPSITVTPLNGLNISGYFRYAPSYAAIYDDYSENFSGTYGSFFVSGLSVSYKLISLGIENRWGSAKYKFDYEEDEYEEPTSYKQKLKTSGARFYLGFRF
ncbi:hypothetical protein GGR21_001684 [Dysgonomonas hofstadii]|uniref:Outer membrane protein beta-barrel domain-containing protein n=1 Tax=Dysgonomonas hofstadii TaxID=637886 RepID=A0A840CM81_9BACT|nr:hypothetical protein [Dysgonomonas hofstadii]MBB4035789.1 hypothetical protein [Dysgonomonas hofstadii]